MREMPPRRTRFVVNVKYHRVEHGPFGRRLEPHMGLQHEMTDDAFGLHPDDRILRAGHAGVGEKRGPPPEYPFIGGLDMCMGADDGASQYRRYRWQRRVFHSWFRRGSRRQ